MDRQKRTVILKTLCSQTCAVGLVALIIISLEDSLNKSELEFVAYMQSASIREESIEMKEANVESKVKEGISKMMMMKMKKM